MKKIGIGAGILVALLIGVALVAPGFIDWNQYKSQIEQQASELSGRNVAINGDLSLSILPSPSFSAENVSVSNIAGGQAKNFISLKSVDVNVAFFPLLRSEVQVKKFILVEPIIAIEIAKNGSGNWEFGAPGEEADDSGTTADLSFEQFQIENGQVSYQNFSTGQQELLKMINASVTMDSLQGPFEVNGNAIYKNLPISAEVMLGLMREGRKVPLSITAGLMNNDVQIKFAGGVQFDENDPQADGKINVDAIDISKLLLISSLLDQQNTSQNVQTYNQPLSLESNVTYGGDAINISGLEFEMGESRGNAKLVATLGDLTRFEGNLSVNSFDLDSFLPALTESSENKKEDETVSNGSGLAFLENIEGTFNLKLGALRFNDKIASQLDVDLNATAGQLQLTKAKINMPGGSELSVTGTLFERGTKPEFNGDIVLNSGNFRAFLDWLKVDSSTIPNGRLTRLSYTGGLRADPELLQFYEIDGSLDTFTFKGGLSYALQERPAFGLDFSVQNLNIDNYMEEDSQEPLNMKEMVSIFADFDANYKLSISDVTIQDVKVKQADFSGELFSGNLNNKVLKIQDYAGFNIDGTVVGNTLGSTPNFDISLTASAASLVPIQRAYRFTTSFDVNQVGAINTTAKIAGDFEKVNVDIKSTIGSTKADAKGEVRSATLKQFPEIGNFDLTVAASNPSLVNIIDQFDLPLEKMSAADDRPVTVNGTLKGSPELLDVDGTIAVAGGNIAVKGRNNQSADSQNTYDFAIDISGQNMREFVRGLGVDFKPSKQDLGAIKLTMAMSGTAEDINLSNITGNLGPTKLNGSGEIKGMSAEKVEGQKPNFNFNLVLDNVPLQDFMEAETEGTAKQDWGNWSKEPMELTALNDYEGRASITANSIRYDKYNFQNPKFEAILKDGVINISNFTGKLFGGDVAVAGSFSSTGDLDMDLSIQNAAIVDATTSFAGIRPITGYFDMTQKITGKGTSQDALISSLNGTGAIKATQGTINGINIPELSQRLNGLSSQNGLLGLLSATLSGGQTPYEGGQSTITTKNGFIQLNPFDVKMAGAKSAVNMGINLAQWKMNLAGDMSLSEHPEAPPIGISIAGALNDPEIKYNTKQLEGFIGAKIASNLLQNMVQGNGGLGGIFGGNQPAAGANAPANTTTQPEQQTQPAPNSQTAPAPNTQPAPAEETAKQEEKPKSVEELGTRLLERLFQKPQQQPQPQN